MRSGWKMCTGVLLAGLAGCGVNRSGEGVAGAFRECARFADVPGTVVYFESAAPVAGKVGIPGERPWAPGEYVMRPIPEAWKRVYAGASLMIDPDTKPEPPMDVVLYSHRRVSKEGDERLVVVGLRLSKKVPGYTHLELWIYAFRLSGGGKVEQTSGEEIGQGSGRAFDRTPVDTAGDQDFVLYGGESDVKDPAKFVIPWSYGGQRIDMTGELKWARGDEYRAKQLRVEMHMTP